MRIWAILVYGWMCVCLEYVCIRCACAWIVTGCESHAPLQSFRKCVPHTEQAPWEACGSRNRRTGSLDIIPHSILCITGLSSECLSSEVHPHQPPLPARITRRAQRRSTRARPQKHIPVLTYHITSQLRVNEWAQHAQQGIAGDTCNTEHIEVYA